MWTRLSHVVASRHVQRSLWCKYKWNKLITKGFNRLRGLLSRWGNTPIYLRQHTPNGDTARGLHYVSSIYAQKHNMEFSFPTLAHSPTRSSAPSLTPLTRYWQNHRSQKILALYSMVLLAACLCHQICYVVERAIANMKMRRILHADCRGYWKKKSWRLLTWCGSCYFYIKPK